jgi:hypothetical protein
VKELPNDSAYARWLQNKENRNFVEYDDELINTSIDKMR